MKEKTNWRYLNVKLLYFRRHLKRQATNWEENNWRNTHLTIDLVSGSHKKYLHLNRGQPSPKLGGHFPEAVPRPTLHGASAQQWLQTAPPAKLVVQGGSEAQKSTSSWASIYTKFAEKKTYAVLMGVENRIGGGG